MSNIAREPLRRGLLVALLMVACGPAVAAGPQPAAAQPAEVVAQPAGVAAQPPSVAFEGFGLGDFQGAGSIASALRQLDAARLREQEAEQLPLSFNVRGPSGREIQLPMAAEVRSRVEQFTVAAGVLADQGAGPTGVAAPPKWVGRIGVGDDRADGSETVELRTTIGRRGDAGLFGVELGPRIERRLPRGTTFFIDGKAEAQAVRAAEESLWSLPGGGLDASTRLGITARTGIVR